MTERSSALHYMDSVQLHAERQADGCLEVAMTLRAGWYSELYHECFRGTRDLTGILRAALAIASLRRAAKISPELAATLFGALELPEEEEQREATQLSLVWESDDAD